MTMELNNKIIAPIRFSVYEDRIIFHASEKAAYSIPFDTIHCVFFKGLDRKNDGITELPPERVAQDQNGYVVLYQANLARWELHMFRCQPGAGRLYEILFRHVPSKNFEYQNEAVYLESRCYG